MAEEYKLSYTAEEIDERLGMAGVAVAYTEQDLTEEEQAQARANIGVTGYYSTEREEIGVDHKNINTAYIWGLYDALMAEYPDKVQKNPIYNDDDTFTNYEYVVSTGDYNEVVGAFNAKDDDIKKPKYLVLSGIHGFEKPAIISTYRFFRDVVTGHNVPAHFREGCVIRFLPVGNPYGLDNNIRFNANGVDINRNFDWKHGENVGTGKNPGTSPESEQETQAIANWLNANTDAALFLDCHNMQGNNEIATFVGVPNSEMCDKWKKIAMRGVDRVVPFWKDVIGYGSQTVFRNSASVDDGGLATFYASEVLSIPSLGLEMSVFPTGNETSREEMASETLAVATEVIGNVLLEFYNQPNFGGEDMAGVNKKLDTILAQVNSGFRIESGIYPVAEDLSGAQTIKVPCTSGAKILVFMPDDTTRDAITSTTDTPLFVGFVGQMLAQMPYQTATNLRYRGYMTMMKANSAGTFVPSDHAAHCDNTDGFIVPCVGLKAGTYHWTAYYWND